MIDTHCHLTYDGLHERVEEVVSDARAAGVDRMISIGTTPEDSARAAALTHQFAGVYATAGVHPHHAGEVADLDLLQRELAVLLAQPKVVAVGEMGLDYHYDEPGRATQRRVFEAQLAVLKDFSKGAGHPDVGLPGVGVIHNREATDDTLAVLADNGVSAERLVFHCFTGQVEEVEKILEAGAMVGFTGIVTFKSAANVAEASDRVPLDRLLIETDSPYLTPVPHRKVRTNEPKYVALVAAFLAERRGMSVEALTEATDANADRFFGLV